MKKILITALCIMGMTSFSQAQDYHTAIGLRGGLSNGLTIKHFTSSTVAIEGIIATRWNGINVTGLYEKHMRAISTAPLNFYYGLGAHIGTWNGRYTYKDKYYRWGERYERYTVVGIDAILGLEYTFKEIPFNIGIDWKPAYNIIGYQGWWADEGAISLRFTF